MPNNISAEKAQVTINGLPIPVRSLSVTRGAYGSNGSFKATSTIQAANIDITTLAKNVGADLRSTVTLGVSVDGGQNYSNLMTGDLDSLNWEFDAGDLDIQGRDFSGRLTETRIVLKNSQYTNMTPSQIATQIATSAGLTPNIIPVANEQTIGYLGENNLAVRTGTPITQWALLVLMARLTGRSVWVSSDDPPTLYFGPVPNNPPRQFVYGGNDPTSVPIRNLSGEYRLFKNSTFQVIVMSYHPKSQQPAQASILVMGQEIQYEALKTIPAGMYKGGAAGSLRLQLGNVLKDKPAYMFYAHALTSQQCDTLAEAIARDIAKRQFIMKGTIDGDATINPLDSIVVKMAPKTPLIWMGSNAVTKPFSIAPFDSLAMYISEVHHTFDMTSGFETALSMWFLPSAASVISEVPGAGSLTPVEAVPIE